MYKSLIELYSDFYNELLEEVTKLDGTIKDFDYTEKIMEIEVAPEHEETVSNILIRLLKKYEEKEAIYKQLKPFEGVLQIIN